MVKDNKTVTDSKDVAKATLKEAKSQKPFQSKTVPKAKPVKKNVRKKRKIKYVEHTRSSGLIFSNRELGWLNFNLRVLAEVEDPRNPLLERLKFFILLCVQ